MCDSLCTHNTDEAEDSHACLDENCSQLVLQMHPERVKAASVKFSGSHHNLIIYVYRRDAANDIIRDRLVLRRLDGKMCWILMQFIHAYRQRLTNAIVQKQHAIVCIFTLQATNEHFIQALILETD